MGAIIWLIAVVGGGYWYYSEYTASAGMTGKQYYETCWEYRSKTIGFKEPSPSNPYQAAQWKNCEHVARRAFFEDGMIFSGIEEGAGYDRLRRACPSSWSEVPIAGLFYLYVADMEKQGGVGTLGALLPASLSVKAWASNRWPNCSKERAAQGYSKVIERADGAFAWETPCPKCK